MSEYIFSPYRHNVTEARIKREEKLASDAFYGRVVARVLVALFAIPAVISLWDAPNLTLLVLTYFAMTISWVCSRIWSRYVLNPLGVPRRHLDRYAHLPQHPESRWEIAVGTAILTRLEEDLEKKRIAVESVRHAKWAVSRYQMFQEKTEQFRMRILESIDIYEDIERTSQKKD